MLLKSGTIVHYDWEHSVQHEVVEGKDGLEIVANPLRMFGPLRYKATGQDVPSGVLQYSPLSHQVVREELHVKTNKPFMRIRHDGMQVLALIVEEAELDVSGLTEIQIPPQEKVAEV
jgi:leucyl-tRNA synthetase